MFLRNGLPWCGCKVHFRMCNLHFVAARHQVMKNEGMESLRGDFLLVKLQNAGCEILHGKVCRPYLASEMLLGLVCFDTSRTERTHKPHVGCVLPGGCDKKYMNGERCAVSKLCSRITLLFVEYFDTCLLSASCRPLLLCADDAWSAHP